jgi:dTDP-4-dehydrorhamnose reductase
MQKILITGSNGFVAYYLIKQLQDHPFQLIITGKGKNTLHLDGNNLVFETLDFTNEENVKMVFGKYRPDVIVHCGAMSKPDDCEQNKENAFRTNVTGTMYLLQQASLLKSFFIFLSTDFVFDGERGMYKEEDATGPVNYYGQTKLLAEVEVRNYPYEWSIVRTVLVYGKTYSNRQNILTNVALGLKEGKELKIFNDQVRTPTFVEDLAKGIVSIILKKAKGIYHLSGEDVLTPYQMAVAVAEFLHFDPTVIKKVTENELKQPARRPLKTGFDLTRSKRELNYKTTSFKEGLKKTFESPS